MSNRVRAVNDVRARPRGRRYNEAAWVHPVPGWPAETPFGAKGPMWENDHTGLDFPAPYGTRVQAVAAGRVVFVGWNGPYGLMVKVRHAPGFETWYCHLSGAAVRKGQNLGAGQKIGQVGDSGNTDGYHLHLEVRVDGQPRDPAPYLSGAVDAPSSPTWNNDAPRPNERANPAAVREAASGVRRIFLLVATVAGGAALVALGMARAVAFQPIDPTP